MLRQIVVLIISLCLVGCCGFKLRGSFTIPAYIKHIVICPDQPYEPFQRELRALLRKNKVTVLCEPGKNTTRLDLQSPNIYDESLAYGPDGQVVRFKYVVSVTYTLTTQEASYTRTISRSRELTRSNNQLLSNENQTQTIKQELLKEVASELLRQITSTTPHNAPMLNTTTADNSPC